MRKFLVNILLFLVSILAGVVVLFLIPVDKKYAYDFISEGGCKGRPPWVYHRIFEDTSSIDIAFIGTSHTMCSINDAWIEKTLLDSTGKNISCCNLACCGFGRDYDFVVIKDLLEHKKVKTIVLEIREEESQLGHLYFPYVANSSDLFSAPLYFNRSYLPDIYKAFIFRLQYLRELFTHENLKHKTDISSSVYGYNGTGNTTNEEELNESVVKAKTRGKRKIRIIENALNRVPMNYVNEIAVLAKNNNAKLVFFYMPSYSGQTSKTQIVESYSKMGLIIFPDEQILKDKANWIEHEHVNIRGEEKVSKEILRALEAI